jgi:hypothetical protein
MAWHDQGLLQSEAVKKEVAVGQMTFLCNYENGYLAIY